MAHRLIEDRCRPAGDLARMSPADGSVRAILLGSFPAQQLGSTPHFERVKWVAAPPLRDSGGAAASGFADRLASGTRSCGRVLLRWRQLIIESAGHQIFLVGFSSTWPETASGEGSSRTGLDPEPWQVSTGVRASVGVLLARRDGVAFVGLVGVVLARPLGFVFARSVGVLFVRAVGSTGSHVVAERGPDDGPDVVSVGVTRQPARANAGSRHVSPARLPPSVSQRFGGFLTIRLGGY